MGNSGCRTWEGYRSSKGNAAKSYQCVWCFSVCILWASWTIEPVGNVTLKSGILLGDHGIYNRSYFERVMIDDWLPLLELQAFPWSGWDFVSAAVSCACMNTCICSHVPQHSGRCMMTAAFNMFERQSESERPPLIYNSQEMDGTTQHNSENDNWWI